MRPKLKQVLWERDGDLLRVVYDIRDYFEIADPDGTVEALLGLLREGDRTVAQLAGSLDDVTVEEVEAALSAFDDQGLLEDADHLGRFSAAERERYFSNLAYFESFATLDRSQEDFQQTLRDSTCWSSAPAGSTPTPSPTCAVSASAG